MPRYCTSVSEAELEGYSRNHEEDDIANKCRVQVFLDRHETSIVDNGKLPMQ
jgi:hypothetical protein